jgi:hypothetical protein
MGGESFQPFTTTRFNTTFYHLFDKDEPKYNRRTIYRMNIITGRDAMLDAFDCPSPSVISPKRVVTTTPQQALALMNQSFVMRQAKALAGRVSEGNEEAGEQVNEAYRRALGRRATKHETQEGVSLIEKSNLENFCWVLLNCSEFLYVR